jgi:hypothetical protein
MISPSSEKRQLVRMADGWELRDLGGTVQFFDATGRWIRTVDSYGNAKEATYEDDILESVSFPEIRAALSHASLEPRGAVAPAGAVPTASSTTTTRRIR